ncbi:MAG: archease, partial [Steroidobacteraceae bacterium]
ANAAIALGSLAFRTEEIHERAAREIAASGGNLESLMYAWLAEILAVTDAERFVFRRAEVTHLGAEDIRGVLHGEVVDRQRHIAGTYIKAVTYHQFEVHKTPSGWRTQVYLDV